MLKNNVEEIKDKKVNCKQKTLLRQWGNFHHDDVLILICFLKMNTLFYITF